MVKTLILAITLMFLVLITPLAYAVEVNEELSDEDKSTVDQILIPIMKIYTVLKYIATAVALIMFLVSGIMFMTAGNDNSKRDSAKNVALYTIIGLIIIWIAPLIVTLFTSA